MWELKFFEWDRLRAAGSAEEIPIAIEALLGAETAQAAEEAYWRIDNVVIVQGALFQAALPTLRCLLVGLHQCTRVSREFVLELICQIASGELAPREFEEGNSNLISDCHRELLTATSTFFALIENATENEKDLCVDILGIAACHHAGLRERVKRYFVRHLDQVGSPRRALLAENWLSELSRSHSQTQDSVPGLIAGG